MLVGRSDVVGRVVELLRELRRGGGALVLQGEAGIGKSALLAEAAGAAGERGYRILRTTGLELEAGLPYAGLHQLLHPVRHHFTTLPPKQRDALEAALGITEGSVTDGYVVALAALNLLTDIARAAPVVLIADDAHWLDTATLSVLGFLGRRLSSEPILLLSAKRIGSGCRLDEAGLPTVDVGPLEPAAASALLKAHAAGLSAAVQDRVLHEAAGNPLALIELPAAVATLDELDALSNSVLPLSVRLERSYARRIEGLPEAVRAVLEVAAVNDRADAAETLDAARVLAGVPVSLDDLAPAVAARLVRQPDQDISFHHPLVRSAIHQVAGASRTRSAHAALARLVEADRDRWAWHAAAATEEPDEAIAAALEEAAARALRRGSNTGAVLAFERASLLSPAPEQRAHRLLKAADCAVTTGRPELMAGLLERAARLDLTPRQRAQIALVRSSYNDGVGEQDTDTVALAGLAEAVAADGDQELALKMIWHVSLRSYWHEPPPAERDRILETAERIPADPLDARIICAIAYSAPIARGRTVLERCRSALQQDLSPFETAMLGAAAVQAGAFDLAMGLQETALAGLREEGRLHTLAKALGAHAYSATQLGIIDAAIPTAQEAVLLARETRQSYMLAFALACQARIAALRGRADETDELAREAEQIAEPVRCSNVLAIAQHARVQAALSRGEFDEALDRVLRMHDPADPTFQLALKNNTALDVAVAAMRSGRIDEAGAVLSQLEEVARIGGSPELVAGLAVARPLVADDDRAEALFHQALATDLGARPFLRARAELAFGLWLRRQRRIVEARRYLRKARDTFDALGALQWSGHARTELRAAGERSGDPAVSLADLLTAQELQIARMAGSGLTNREIGKQLYISHRTVGAHLANAYAKLGVTSRVQLAGVVGSGEPPRVS